MEWVKPIDQVEADFRHQGVFLLVDMDRRTLRFYRYGKDCLIINRLVDSIKGRGTEMVNFLIARASARGETT